MTQTEQKENPVIAALVKAKSNFGGVTLDCENKFHKNKYASLGSINRATDSALLEQGLVIVQRVVIKEDKSYLVASLLHTSGVYDPHIQESWYLLPETSKSQEIGSAMTYGRRYNKSALLELVAETEDDGNASTSINTNQYKRLISLAKQHKWKDEDVKQLIKDQGFNSGTELNLSAYQTICNVLENKE